MNHTTRFSLLAVLGLWLVSTVAFAGESDILPAGPPDEGTVVFLVRHAEKSMGPGGEAAPDPGLTGAGRERAEALARILSPAGVTAIHSTDFRRTRETARPLAERLGLEVKIYGARDLEVLAGRLRDSAGRHLVVGHSNTTPEFVAMLGGEPGPPIDEACEYDRLYVLVLVPDRSATTIQQRYGSPSCP